MKVFVNVVFVLLFLVIPNSDCSYLSIFEEYESALNRRNQPEVAQHESDSSDQYGNSRFFGLGELYGSPFVPHPPPPSDQRASRSEKTFDYDEYSKSSEIPSDGNIFAPHPPEVLNAFDTPNVERAFTVGVNTDTVELSKRSVIVKPIIQYVIHQIKKSQANLRDPEKNHISWQSQAETGKGWWTATDPRTSIGGSFSFGNSHDGQGKGMPQYESDDNKHAGVALNAQAYFDTHGGNNLAVPQAVENNGWSGTNGGSFSQMNDYSNMGETVPTPFSPQDLRGSYGPGEQQNPRMNRPPSASNNNVNNMSFMNGHQSNPTEGGRPTGGMMLERPPVVDNNNPSQMCSTSWGWGCVQMAGGAPPKGLIMGNLNHVVTQTSSPSNLNNFNNHLDSSSNSILTQKFGQNPSIAEAISTLLKTVADSGGGSRGSFRFPPSQQYGPPGFMPGPPISNQMPMMMMMTAGTPSPNPISAAMTTAAPPTSTTMTSTVLIASTTVGAVHEEVGATSSGGGNGSGGGGGNSGSSGGGGNGGGGGSGNSVGGVSGNGGGGGSGNGGGGGGSDNGGGGGGTGSTISSASTMQGLGDDKQKPRQRPTDNNGSQKQRGQGRRNKGLNAYFRVLVAGGLGQDPSAGNHNEEQPSSQRGNKQRGFSFGFNYPPRRRGLFSRGRHSSRNRGRGRQNYNEQQEKDHQQDVERRLGYYYDYEQAAV